MIDHSFLRRGAALMLAATSLLTANLHGTTVDVTTTAPNFILWQLPEQTHSQMMSYVLRTHTGKLIVIDGGTAGDAPYLRGFLAALGNDVHWWFISHQHSDHHQALTEILKTPQHPKIGRIYASLLPTEWLQKHAGAEDVADDNAFRAALSTAETTVTDLEPGTTLEVDGVRIEVLAGRNPELTRNAINDQSVVLRVSDAGKSVLFLGDLGEAGGNKILSSAAKIQLRSDYVQMAHHGQNGVNEAFYQAVAPRVCLWPTPRWLWENDKGTGKSSGPWRTLEVREWMEHAGIKRNYVSADGLVRIQ